MDVAQGQIVQAAGGDLLLGDGAVAAAGGRVPVETGQRQPSVLRRLKAGQGGVRLVGGTEGPAIDGAVELGQVHPLHSGRSEDVDVVRPLQGGVHRGGAIAVVVARGQEHRAGDAAQCLGEGLGRLPIDGLPVHQVAGQQHQVGLLLPGQLGQAGQQVPLLPPPLGRPLRAEAGKGAVQMEVRPVNDVQHGLHS